MTSTLRKSLATSYVFFMMTNFLPILLLQAVTSLASDGSNGKPNFVIFLADDMGIGDVGCFGNDTIRPPAIDSLAKDGAKLTSYYSSQAVCSASRAAILTGAYSNRIGINGAFGPKSS